MNIRLQKVIASSGLCSRRKAELYIQAGHVSVNGKVCRVLGTKVDPTGDEISVLGKTIKMVSNRVYYLFHKPKNVVSTLHDPEQRPCIADYLKKIPERVYPVGRLDFSSEGLMILTSDGRLTQRVSHPSGGIHKRYRVQAHRRVTPQDVECIEQGATVEGKRVKPVSVHISGKGDWTWLELVIAEGRKHEVRVLCEGAGLKIKRLIRVAIGDLKLMHLEPGQLKRISYEQMKRIFPTI